MDSRSNYVITYTDGSHYLLLNRTKAEAMKFWMEDGDHVVTVTPASIDDASKYRSLEEALRERRG